MKKEKHNWEDLDSYRSILLSQTNWTQLENAGLGENAKVRWREWRKELTSINRNNYSDIDLAISDLRKLRNSLPELQYPENTKTIIMESYNQIDRSIIKDMVKDILTELQTEHPLDLTNNISTAKSIAQKELKSVYKSKIKSVSPPIETFQLYIERLNQAVDLLSDNGTEFPLLAVLSQNMKKDTREIALDILKHHTSMISSFVLIEELYLQSLKALNESDTIHEIESILEKFNGY